MALEILGSHDVTQLHINYIFSFFELRTLAVITLFFSVIQSRLGFL